MAKVTLKLGKSNIDSNKGEICYHVIDNSKERVIRSNIKIQNNEWDSIKSTIKIPAKISTRRQTLLIIRDRVYFNLRRLNVIAATIDGGVDEVCEVYCKSFSKVTIFNFLLDLTQQLRVRSNIRTAETYLASLSSFMTYREGRDMLISSLDHDMIESYEAFLKHRNLALNSISFYMRTLRAAYNRAVDRGLVVDQKLFKRAFTNIERTAKRAIPIRYIKRIKELESRNSDIEFARDMFLFSFYTRGMSFVDMAYLRKRDVKNGELCYRRQKTGQQLRIRWEKCMEELVNRYVDHNTEYLLPIVSSIEREPREQYLYSMRTVNRNLKRVAQLANININLTMYVARHSWASAAKSKNIPITVISEGMGHDNESTTQIYLASLDTAVVDRANRMILKLI